jgi:leucyl-tRNA synthetase
MEHFVLLLSPLAPHIAEELWQVLGHSGSLAYAPWPEFDETFTREDTIEMPIQINGRIRGRIIIPISASEEELNKAALSDPKVQKYLEGKTVRKIIFVPKKLINIVVG